MADFLTRIKQINSHVGYARFLAECDQNEDESLVVACYLARVQTEDIPSPYAYSPSKPVLLHKGRKVVVFETRHKHYEVFALSPHAHTFETDEAAADYHVRFTLRGNQRYSS